MKPQSLYRWNDLLHHRRIDWLFVQQFIHTNKKIKVPHHWPITTEMR